MMCIGTAQNNKQHWKITEAGQTFLGRLLIVRDIFIFKKLTGT
jgi:hypothetical protein